MWLSCLLDLYFDINHVYNVLHVLLTIVTAATVLDEEAPKFSMYPKQNERTNADKNNLVQIPTNGSEITQLPLQVKVDRTIAQDGSVQIFGPYNPSQNVKQSTNGVKDAIHLKHIPTVGHRDVQPVLALANQRVDTSKISRFSEGGQLVSNKTSNELSLDVEDLDIPWSDLVLKERIGAGISTHICATSWRENTALIARTDYFLSFYNALEAVLLY